MLKKIFFNFVAVVFLAAFYVSGGVFAQGDAVVCTGAVSGVTGSVNVNTGVTTFDAHGPIYRDNFLTSLAILGLGRGYAPADKGHAACTEKVEGVYDGVNYDHRMKGFAWNENLGFISFSCEGGRNRSGAIGGGAACGPFDYGVYFSRPDVNGVRSVHGYAYNGAFGYIQFDQEVFSDVAVRVDANGEMYGYAWSEAGVWIDFNGINVDLFDEEVFDEEDLDDEDLDKDLVEERWCDERGFLCVEVEGASAALGGGFGVGGDDMMKVADGVDGYFVDLYLRDANGNALGAGDYNVEGFLDSVRLEWLDTVKLDQTIGGENDYSSWRRPFEASSGAVLFKPLAFADFVEVENGHYRSREAIRSYAPTTGGNYSWSSGEPPFAFNNELFLTEVEGVSAIRQSNALVLRNVTHGDLIRKVDGEVVFPAGSVFAEGLRNGVALDFAPAVRVEALYANSGDDSMSIYRGIPVNLHLETVAYGGLKPVSYDSVTIDLNLGYNAEDTEHFENCSVENFNFSFLNNFNGEQLNGVSSSLRALSKHINRDFDLQVMASVPEVDEEDGEFLPCNYAQAPTVYSKVNYIVGGNKVVRYFSNKLPRTTAQTLNPSVVVHGNIYAQDIGAVSEGNRPRLQGNLDTNVVRNTVNASLERYSVFESGWSAVGGRCEIGLLENIVEDKYSVSGEECKRGLWKAFEIGDEKVLYFKNQDVSLNLRSGSLEGKWVVVVDGGNIFIDNSVKIDGDVDKRLTLMAFRGEGARYARTGHGYLVGGKPLIVDSTMVFDGSLFAYAGGDESFMVDERGVPIWHDERARADVLGYQALIRGSIFSDNTIGGADLDSGDEPKDYLLLGGGEVLRLPLSTELRRRVQSYDLNYLRLFSLEVEMCENGYPKDQVCGRCLSPEDIVAIAQGNRLCGERGDCDVNGQGNQYVCNGINPYLRYQGGAQDFGDLVPPRDLDRLVPEGLDPENDFDPVYVFFRAPAKDSFVFRGR